MSCVYLHMRRLGGAVRAHKKKKGGGLLPLAMRQQIREKATVCTVVGAEQTSVGRPLSSSRDEASAIKRVISSVRWDTFCVDVVCCSVSLYAEGRHGCVTHLHLADLQ